MSEEQLSLPDQETKTDSTVKAVEVIKICDELVSQKQGLQREETHGLQREEKYGPQREEKYGLQREEKNGLQSEEKYGLQREEKYGLQREEKHGLQRGEKHGLQREEKHVLQREEKHGLQRGEKHGLQREEKHAHGLQRDEKHGLQREPTIPKEDATIFGKDEEASKKEEQRDLVKEAMQGGLVDGGQQDGGGAGQVMIPVVVTGSQPQDHPPTGSYHHGYFDYSGYGQNPPMAVGDDGQVVGAGYGYQHQQQPPQNALPVGWAYSPAQGYYTAGGSHQYMGYQKPAGGSGGLAGGSGGLAGGINRASSQGERKSLKMMPSIVTRLTEKRYLILSNPAFIETELDAVKEVTGFIEAQDKIGRTEESKIVVQRLFSNGETARRKFDAYSNNHSWGKCKTLTTCELREKPLIGEEGPADVKEPKAKRQYTKKK